MIRKVYDGEIHDISNKTTAAFLAVNSCGVHLESSWKTVRRHGRRDWHLLYVESGEMAAVVDGKQYEVHSGGMILYPPGQRQEYWQNGGVCYWVHFAGKCTEEVLALAGLNEKHVVLEGKNEPAIAKLFEKMIFEEAQHLPCRELTLGSQLAALIAALGRQQDDSALVCTDERMRSVIIHMNKHFTEEVDIQVYADLVGLSRGRFAHVFRDVIGCAPYSYVLDLRFAKAKELLKHSALPISRISEQIGMTDPLYFSRAFKRKYGMSPEMYRRASEEEQKTR